MPCPWKSRPNVTKLQRTNDALAAALTRVRAELEAATRHRTGLKVMLAVREKRIDALSFEIERRKESAGRIRVSYGFPARIGVGYNAKTDTAPRPQCAESSPHTAGRSKGPPNARHRI